MTREETVAVKLVDGIDGAVHYAHGQRYGLFFAGGAEVLNVWLDGSPITRGEFETILKPEGIFLIIPAPPENEGEKE